MMAEVKKHQIRGTLHGFSVDDGWGIVGADMESGTPTDFTGTPKDSVNLTCAGRLVVVTGESIVNRDGESIVFRADDVRPWTREEFEAEFPSHAKTFLSDEHQETEPEIDASQGTFSEERLLVLVRSADILKRFLTWCAEKDGSQLRWLEAMSVRKDWLRSDDDKLIAQFVDAERRAARMCPEESEESK